MPSPLGFSLVAAVAGFGAMLALGGVWIAVRDHRAIGRSATAEGTVQRAAVEAAEASGLAERMAAEGGGEAAGAEHATGDAPVVAYSYMVDGEQYESEGLWPTGTAPVRRRLTQGNPSFARSVVEPYAEGDTVTVHYDPDAPGESFLFAERNVGAALIFALAGGAVLAWAVSVL